MKLIEFIIKFKDDIHEDIKILSSKDEHVGEIINIDSKLYIEFIEYNFERPDISKYLVHKFRKYLDTICVYHIPTKIVKKVIIKF